MKNTRFIILFSGRSGGTLLQRSLNNHSQVICNGEIVQELPFRMQLQRMNWALNRFDDEVSACGFKTKLFEFRSRHHSLLKEYLARHSIKVLHLYRENVVKHALSHYVGNRLYRKTKAWEIYDQKDRITPLTVDRDEFKGSLSYIAEWERRNFLFVQDLKDVLPVRYEDLAADKQGMLARVQEWLGVEVRDDLIEPMQKVTPDDLGEAISNYDEFASWLCEMSSLPGMKEWTYFTYLDHQRRILDNLAHRQPDEVKALVAAAWLALAENDQPAAKDRLQKALKLAPRHAEVKDLVTFLRRRQSEEHEWQDTSSASFREPVSEGVELRGMEKAGDLSNI